MRNYENIIHCLDKLKDLRGDRKQDDIAKCIGMSASGYGKIELGVCGFLQVDHIISLAKLYNVSLDDLFGLKK